MDSLLSYSFMEMLSWSTRRKISEELTLSNCLEEKVKSPYRVSPLNAPENKK